MRPALVIALAACTAAPARVSIDTTAAAERLATLASAMQHHDPMFARTLYVDARTSAGLAIMPVADVAASADSLLELIDDDDSPAATALATRLRALRGRAVLLSGATPDLGDVRALQDVGSAVPAAPVVSSTARAASPSAPHTDGRLRIPVAGVGPADLTDTFGDSRGEGRAHGALDIMAPRGTPVVAAAAGRILRRFTSERGGLTLYQLHHDGRTVLYYAHLDRYHATAIEGRDAAAGDTLGYVGDTGNAAPGNYHLHFAMWHTDDPARYWDGAPINPYPLLQPGLSRPLTEESNR